MSDSVISEENLFTSAAALPPSERQALLNLACQRNPGLRARVEALLRAHDAAQGFMEPLVNLSEAAAPAPQEAPGQRIGRYKLLQKIGEGGCGVVYMAEQEESVQRRVALKVIKLGMDTRAVIARFEAERQALARMEHPNIARVLDAGATANGRPFFVMELVRGVRITEYCDQNNLATEDRIELVIKVCHAIQHAHQKGIIHRDIKPSNILVTLHDGEPVPKVIDFGIAKATQGRLTDLTLFTAFDQFIGTPAYVSPEQAEMSGLDIDTRSDIYSLGVLLYELLTGSTPFDSRQLTDAGIGELRRRIREEEPPRPSVRLRTLADADRTSVAQRRGTNPPRLSLRLRGDLDWVVMRCLEKDRRRRYESADALALDLRRHLQNEPVIARAPSTAYLLQKLVRRHRFGVAAGAVVVATLLAGFLVSTSLFLRARDSLARAQSAERERGVALATALQQKNAAELASANEARLRLLAEAGEARAQTEATRRGQLAAFTTEIVKDIGELVAIDGDPKPVIQVLKQTAARLNNEGRQQPDFQEVLGGVYFNVGQLTNAESIMREALALRRAQPAGDRIDEAQTLNYLGLVLNAQDKLSEAEEFLREALGLLQRSANADARRFLALSRANLGWILGRQGRFGEAEDMIRDAVKRQQELLGPEHLDVATSLKRLGAVLMEEGRIEEAEAHLREALRITRRRFGDEHIEVASTLNFLAVTLAMQAARNPDKIREGLARYREGQQLRERLKNPGSHQPPRESLVAVLEQQGTVAEVEAMLKEARRYSRRHFPPGSWEDAYFLALTGYVQLAEGRWSDAENSARESFGMRVKLRPDDWSTFHAQHMIGAALAGQKKFAEAEPLLIKGYLGMKQQEAAMPPFHLMRLTDALQRIVKCYLDWGRPADAAKWQGELDKSFASAPKN